ncbi:hypothetical protein [Streptomyces sp. NPDC093984]|uniref:hypothetical protein n=1 Tax=Streptomyces sp. NPDC093984 TaxID=3366052 RepID=UPI0038125C46
MAPNDTSNGFARLGIRRASGRPGYGLGDQPRRLPRKPAVRDSGSGKCVCTSSNSTTRGPAPGIQPNTRPRTDPALTRLSISVVVKSNLGAS